MVALKPLLISGREVLPLVEGGKGISVSNGESSGAWAAAGGVGTFSGVNADSYDADGNQFPLAEMDPFTFFSTFNRNQAVGTRIAIVEAIKNEWGLDAPVPQDFDGVPQANAQNSWYFSYKKSREPHAVALLWRAAREACSSTFRNYDAKLFDETLDVRFVGFAKLTFGLFWLNPRGFLCYALND